jgi:hypothetical protein
MTSIFDRNLLASIFDRNPVHHKWNQPDICYCHVNTVFIIRQVHSISDNLCRNAKFIRFRHSFVAFLLLVLILDKKPVHEKVKPGLKFPCQCI